MQPPTHPASEYPTYTLKGFSLAPGENARIHRLAFLPPRARTARIFLFLPSLGRETRSYIFLLAFPRRGEGGPLAVDEGENSLFLSSFFVAVAHPPSSVTFGDSFPQGGSCRERSSGLILTIGLYLKICRKHMFAAP